MIRRICLAVALALSGTAAAAQSDRNAIEVQPLDDPADQGGSFTPGGDQPGFYTPEVDEDFLGEYDDGIALENGTAPQTEIEPGERAPDGAMLRALDTVSGRTADLTVRPGELVDFGRLTIQMTECRYPVENPEGDAFAYLVIVERGDDNPSFRGWMVASSPGLNALDHRRYDVWVLGCVIPEGAGTDASSGN